ncbi:ABC transporter ATP-binding protein OS=Bosea thiooxidans OX=53254 GN=ARD30_00445 PE=3 SV=1 [Bosea thiooxidans]
MFKAIFGLLKLREGRIRFDGQDITGWNQRKLLEVGIGRTVRRGATSSRSSRRVYSIELVIRLLNSGITDMPQRLEAVLDRFLVPLAQGRPAGIDAVRW